MATIVDELVSILGYEIRGEEKLKRYQAGIETAAKKVNRLTTQIVAYSAAADKAFNASRTMAVPSALAILYAKRIKDASLKTTGWAQAFNAVTGSAKAATDEIEFAAEVADRYGANVVKVTDGWVKFKAATKGTEVAGESKEIFQTFTALSSMLGQTPDQLNGILTALEQMVSKGKVSAEELRDQLGERLPGAFIAAAKSMGVTTAELDKMLEQGKLTADVLLPKLTKQLQEDYKINLSERIENEIATFNRLDKSLFMLKVAIAKSGFIGFLEDLAKGLTKVVKKLASAPPWVQKLVASLISLLAISAPLLFTFGAMAKSIATILKVALALRSLVGAFAAMGVVKGGDKLIRHLSFFRKNKGVIKALKALRFGFALLAAPILKVAAAVALLYLGIDDLYHFLTGGKSVIGALLEQLKTGDLFAYGEELGKKLVHGIFEGARRIGLLGDKIEKLLSDPNFYKAGFEIIGSIVSGLALAVMAMGSAMGSAFANVAAGIFWGILNALLGYDAKEQMTLMVTDLIEDFVEAWNSLINFYDMGVEMVNQLFEGMKSIGGKIKDWFADLVPEWAQDFIGGDNEAEINNTVENLAGNLDRSASAAELSTNNLNNSSTNNNAHVSNQINIEQNVSQAVKAPDQLAKATQRAMGGVMPKRSQLQQEPIAP